MTQKLAHISHFGSRLSSRVLTAIALVAATTTCTVSRRMARICNACTMEIAEASISCCLCDSPFHQRCTSVPADLFLRISEYKQLHWCCIGCNNVFMNPRTKFVKDAAMQSGFQAAITTVAESIKTVMEPLTNEIKTGFARMSQLDLKTPRSSHPPAKIRRINPSKRLFSDVIKDNHALFTFGATSNQRNSQNNNTKRIDDVQRKTHAPPVITGTKKDIAAFPIKIVPAHSAVQKCALYISRLSPDTTSDQIVQMVKQALSIDDATAYCLIRQGTNTATLSFLSFKVLVPLSLRDKALSPDTWPLGLSVREFIDYRTQQPSANFRIQPPMGLSTPTTLPTVLNIRSPPLLDHTILSAHTPRTSPTPQTH